MAAAPATPHPLWSELSRKRQPPSSGLGKSLSASLLLVEPHAHSQGPEESEALMGLHLSPASDLSQRWGGEHPKPWGLLREVNEWMFGGQNNQ